MTEKKTKEKTVEKQQMKMIDFRAINVMNIEDKPECLDLAKQLGNLIYSQARDLAEVKLAREMYKNGRIEIDEEQADIILRYTDNYPYVIQEAFKKALQF